MQDAESDLPETQTMTEEFSEVSLKEPEVNKPKPQSKPFSWADMASKNTPAPRTNVQQGTVVKVNRPEPVRVVREELRYQCGNFCRF